MVMESQGPPITSGTEPETEEQSERRAYGEKRLGYDSTGSGWGPGLDVSAMPGAPGANDSWIFAQQRARHGAISSQQFGEEESDDERQERLDQASNDEDEAYLFYAKQRDADGD